MDIPPQIPPEELPANSPNENEAQPEEIRASELVAAEFHDSEPILQEANPSGEIPSEVIPPETIPTDPVPQETYFLSEERLEADERSRLLRRLRWVLLAGVASFTLVSWMLLRTLERGGIQPRGSDPAAVVRVELGALASGDLKSAYDQLSERYRKEVSFEAYHQLVITHRRVFLTRQYRVTHLEQQNGKTLLEAQLTSASGQHFLARFTLVNTAGRWWIDDLHWNAQGGGNTTQV